MDIINKIGKYKARDWHERNEKDIRYITIHHSSITGNKSNEEILKELEKYHKTNGWAGLSFHYVISKDGKIYQINHHEEIVWHDRVNRDSIGIVLDGYFHEPHNEIPTKEQLKTLKNILYKLRRKLSIHPNHIIGHRDRSSTICPGDILYKYVKEYQKEGNAVNWGYLDENIRNIEEAFNPKITIPGEWAELLNLNKQEWFNNKWSFEKFLESVNDWYSGTIIQTKGINTRDKEIEMLKDRNSDIEKHLNILKKIIDEKNKTIKTNKIQIDQLEKGIIKNLSFKALIRGISEKTKTGIKSVGARGGI